jgi:hypothetical protein
MIVEISKKDHFMGIFLLCKMWKNIGGVKWKKQKKKK